jgi:hypothetical protein
MRRLDLRPSKKLRNPGRHLRALARWPQRIALQLPTGAGLKEQVATGRGFWNFKIPVFEKLSDPPHATPDTQRACIATLFAATEAVERAPDRPANARIACLVTTPFLFQSEVTIFMDEDYFRSFLPVPGTKRTPFDGGWIESSPADPATISSILPPAPRGLTFHGGTNLLEHDDQWEQSPVLRTNWVWAFERR